MLDRVGNDFGVKIKEDARATTTTTTPGGEGDGDDDDSDDEGEQSGEENDEGTKNDEQQAIEIAYISEETPMVSYLNVHGVLEAKRKKARDYWSSSDRDVVNIDDDDDDEEKKRKRVDEDDAEDEDREKENDFRTASSRDVVREC